MKRYADPVVVCTVPVPIAWRGAFCEVAVEVKVLEAGKGEAQHCASENDDYEHTVRNGKA